MLTRLRLLIYILSISVLLYLLFFTRFVNINWSMGYPFHPDERNMADAVTKLGCDFSHFRIALPFLKDCFNPQFFAYGQLPLYGAYLLAFGTKLMRGMQSGVGFGEALIALRVISAVASLCTVYFAVRITQIFVPKQRFRLVVYTMPFIFSPVLIQFAHFGTTESLLMLCYMILLYLSLAPLKSRLSHVILMGLVVGTSIGIKSSAALYAFLPLVALAGMSKTSLRRRVHLLFCFSGIVLVAYIFTSPHNLISWSDFRGSMKYESEVALGTLRVFYTRTFDNTVPFSFQFVRIFPYALGIPVLLLFVVGFVVLPWTKKYNLLRFAYLVYAVPSSLFYTKWTRFMAPVYPLMILIACLTLQKFYETLLRYTSQLRLKGNNSYLFLFSHFLFLLSIFSFVLPGIAFLSIYTNSDVRFQASYWIATHMKNDSLVLQETANVVDLPIYPSTHQLTIPRVQNISFNFYDLDQNPQLQSDLSNNLQRVSYIIIPSRRIVANHTCLDPDQSKSATSNMNARCAYLKKTYPKLNAYYQQLFDGSLGFHQVAQFDSFPRLEVGGWTVWKQSDEAAEETWTVFDHPVIRIYKRTNPKNIVY